MIAASYSRALSDGRDTLSSVPAHSVSALLQRRGVTLDAVCVGNETSDALRAIAKAAGGYCFHPARLRDAWNKKDHHLQIGEKVADVRADARKAVEKHRLAAEGRDVRRAEKHRKK